MPGFLNRKRHAWFKLRGFVEPEGIGIEPEEGLKEAIGALDSISVVRFQAEHYDLGAAEHWFQFTYIVRNDAPSSIQLVPLFPLRREVTGDMKVLGAGNRHLVYLGSEFSRIAVWKKARNLAKDINRDLAALFDTEDKVVELDKVDRAFRSMTRGGDIAMKRAENLQELEDLQKATFACLAGQDRLWDRMTAAARDYRKADSPKDVQGDEHLMLGRLAQNLWPFFSLLELRKKSYIPFVALKEPLAASNEAYTERHAIIRQHIEKNSLSMYSDWEGFRDEPQIVLDYIRLSVFQDLSKIASFFGFHRHPIEFPLVTETRSCHLRVTPAEGSHILSKFRTLNIPNKDFTREEFRGDYQSKSRNNVHLYRTRRWMNDYWKRLLTSQHTALKDRIWGRIWTRESMGIILLLGLAVVLSLLFLGTSEPIPQTGYLTGAIASTLGLIAQSIDKPKSRRYLGPRVAAIAIILTFNQWWPWLSLW